MKGSTPSGGQGSGFSALAQRLLLSLALTADAARAGSPEVFVTEGGSALPGPCNKGPNFPPAQIKVFSANGALLRALGAGHFSPSLVGIGHPTQAEAGDFAGMIFVTEGGTVGAKFGPDGAIRDTGMTGAGVLDPAHAPFGANPRGGGGLEDFAPVANASSPLSGRIPHPDLPIPIPSSLSYAQS